MESPRFKNALRGAARPYGNGQLALAPRAMTGISRSGRVLVDRCINIAALEMNRKIHTLRIPNFWILLLHGTRRTCIRFRSAATRKIENVVVRIGKWSRTIHRLYIGCERGICLMDVPMPIRRGDWHWTDQP